MTKRLAIITVASAIVVAFLLCTVAYTVRYDQQALVTTFGVPSAPIQGRTDAGLKFKWPWPIQKVIVYPATMFTLEDAISEVQTRDNQKILLTTYCVWRIDDTVKFHKSKETVKAAEKELRNLLASVKSAVAGSHELADFVNTDPQKMQIPDIEGDILALARTRAQKDWGIEVASVGIKTLGLPEGVTAKVIAVMQEERESEARMLRSKGEATAIAIRARAEEASTKIIAFAERKAESIESEGSRAAAALYPQFAANEEFSEFLRIIKSLETELSGRSQIILDGSLLPGVRFLREGPSLRSEVPGAPPQDKKRK